MHNDIALLYYAAAANIHLSSLSCHVTVVGGLLGSILAVSLIVNHCRFGNGSHFEKLE